MEWMWLCVPFILHATTVCADSLISLTSSLEKSGRELASEEEVVQFTCTANFTALLLWYVEPSGIIPQDDPLAFIPSSDGVGREPLQRGEFTATLIKSVVTSNDNGLYGNLTSILQVTLQLNGSIVFCSSEGLAGPSVVSKVLRITGDCGTPEAPINGTIKKANSTVEGSVVVYGCLEGLVPDEDLITVCSISGVWTPNPKKTHCREPDTYACPMSAQSLQQVLGVSLPLTVLLTAAVSAVAGAMAGGGCVHYQRRQRNNTNGDPTTAPTVLPLREATQERPSARPLPYEYVSNQSYVHPTAQVATNNYDDVLPVVSTSSVDLQQNIAYSRVLSS